MEVREGREMERRGGMHLPLGQEGNEGLLLGRGWASGRPQGPAHHAGGEVGRGVGHAVAAARGGVGRRSGGSATGRRARRRRTLPALPHNSLSRNRDRGSHGNSNGFVCCEYAFAQYRSEFKARNVGGEGCYRHRIRKMI